MRGGMCEVCDDGYTSLQIMEINDVRCSRKELREVSSSIHVHIHVHIYR